MSNRPKSKVQYGTPVPQASPNETSSLAPKIAIGAVLVAVVVAIIIAAVNDGSGTAKGIDPSSKVSFQPVSISGDALPAFPEKADSQVPTNDPAIGKKAPEITGKTFDGTAVVIKPGKPQLVAVVAHWCPHCQHEVPLLVGWRKSGLLPKELQVTAVSTAAEEIKGNYPPASWLQKEDWTDPVLVDSPTSQTMDAFGATGFPTLVAIDKNGVVVRRASGELTADQVKILVDAALGKTPAADTGGTGTPATSPVPTSAP